MKVLHIYVTRFSRILARQNTDPHLIPAKKLLLVKLPPSTWNKNYLEPVYLSCRADEPRRRGTKASPGSIAGETMARQRKPCNRKRILHTTDRPWTGSGTEFQPGEATHGLREISVCRPIVDSRRPSTMHCMNFHSNVLRTGLKSPRSAKFLTQWNFSS